MAVHDRVSQHRRRMREAGYRPIQVWVPDVRTDAFAHEAHRQSLVVGASNDDIQDFIEAVSAPWEEA